MTFDEFAATLEYHDMDSFPWVEDLDWDEDSLRRWAAPVGVVVKLNNGRHRLLGDDLAGHRSAGCDCCSREYNRSMPNAVAWAWVNPAMELRS